MRMDIASIANWFFIALCVVGIIYVGLKCEDYKLKLYMSETSNMHLERELGKFREMLVQELEVTAYSLSRNECNDDLKNTATMSTPKPGWTVAVSRDLSWMLGKKVYIDGLGIRKVEDLMNSRHSNAMDILMPDKSTAKDFGRKTMSVVIIES